MLTGTFHSLNRGDSSMQLVAARHLHQRWPNAQIAIHCPHADADRELYRDYEIVACSRRRPMHALRAILTACLWRATRGLVPLSRELQSYQTACLVVDCSGDSLTETFSRRCPLSHTVPLLLAFLLRTPFCLMGQTIGPFRRFRRWFRWIIGRAVFITARDEETFHYLAGWRMACPLEVTADLAFLLEPTPLAEARRYLARMGDYDPSRPLVGITPSNLHNVKGARQLGSQSSSRADLRAIATACRALERDTRAQILIIPHVFGPGENYDDRRAADALATLLEPSLHPLVVQEALTPSQLKGLIGCCDLFIGMRMHSVIGAVSQAVPTIALTYSPKFHGLMDRLGLRRFTLDCNRFSADDLCRLAHELWSTRGTVVTTLQRALANDFLPVAERNFGVLIEYLSTSLQRGVSPHG